MKVGKPDEARVTVTIKEVIRDEKGKTKYQVFESFDVYDAKPETVYKVAFDAIKKA